MSDHNEIYEVCGVSSADILRRCAEIRKLRSDGLKPILRSGQVAANAECGRKWRLLDLGDGSAEVFIEAAYLALLCRSPLPDEAAWRLRQLRSGRTRLELILRLALSAEGRCVKQSSVTGIALPALRRLAVGLAILQRLIKAAEVRLFRRDLGI